MHPIHGPHIRTPAGLAPLLLLLVLGACASAGVLDQAAQRDAPAGSAAAAGDGDAAALPGEAEPGGGDEQAGPQPPAQLAERDIIKTGEITIEVEDVATALAAVRTLAIELGGYVGASQAGDREASATLTLRLPADRFDDALGRLRELDGEVLGEATREEDVTRSIVDLEARIENLRASEASYRALAERATDIEDILAIQTRLDQVRGEIEQLAAQREALQGQADLSTLVVSLVPAAVPVVEEAAEGWNPGETVQEALAAMVSLGQGLVTVLIWLGIVWLPVLGAIGLGLALILRLSGVLRRRLPGEPPAA